LFKKNHQVLICILLLVTGSILLFLGGPDYYSSRSFQSSWDLGHIVYFALLTWLLMRWHVVNQLSPGVQWTIILLVTLLVGISIEVMQYGTGRTPDAGDVLRDVTGSLLVLAFAPSGLVSQPLSRRYALQISVLVLLLVQLWPLTNSLIDEAIARQQFPLLSAFETPFEIYRWGGNAELSVESVPSVARGKLLKMPLTTDQYSGATLKYFNGNWASFNTLEISLYNPGVDPLQITCRIHDLQHVDGNEEYEDRFNRSFLLKPGWNEVVIDLNEVQESPAGRSMDMNHIIGLGIFVVALPEPRVLYLDKIQLSP
jgi:VanZ family protein